MKSRRVVITGVGIVSTIGVGVEETTAGLAENRSGIRLVPERRELGFRSALSGVIGPFQPRFELSKKKRKSMHTMVEWAHEATMEALTMSALPDESVRSPRTGLIFGNDSVAAPSYLQAFLTRERKSTSALHSGMVFQSMNSTVTLNLNALLGTLGASWTLSGACASGGHSIGQAFDLIAHGRQDRVICGGVQEITWESVCSFDALCAFSLREDDPAAASRPFDADRDGLAPSGGAAAIVLEEREQAVARGAEILGEVLAYAFSSDGTHVAVPTGDGLVRAMTEALERAGVQVSDVHYVSAHATGTPIGDAVEAEAISLVFGAAKPWVSSIKGMVGHEMWMAGASQLVYSLLAGRAGFIPGSRNFDRPDDHTRLLRIPREPVRCTPELMLLNSAGFGGTNSCLVIRLGR